MAGRDSSLLSPFNQFGWADRPENGAIFNFQVPVCGGFVGFLWYGYF